MRTAAKVTGHKLDTVTNAGGLVTPTTPAQKAMRQKARSTFAELVRQGRKDQQMIESHHRLRVHRMTQRWIAEGEAMIQCGFPYGFLLQDMAAEQRARARL